MKVKEVIKSDIITVKRSTSLKNLLSLFKDFHTLPIIPVINDDKRIIGIVHIDSLLGILKYQESELLKNIPFSEINEDVFDLELSPSMGELILVDDIMDVNYVSLEEDTSLETAYKTMRLHNKEQLPVVDDNNCLLGIVGVFDIVCRMFKKKGII